MTERRCQRRWEIDAVRDGRLSMQDAESFERHRQTCPECHARIEQDQRLAQLGGALASDQLDEVTVKRLRARLLHDAARGARGQEGSRALVAAASFMLVCALGLTAAVAWRNARPAPVAPAARDALPAYAAHVTAIAGARFSQTRHADVEYVRLEAGTILVRVRHQARGERFLVDLPDGQIEVRGTTFSVTVENDATTQVSVIEGLVALRLRSQPERLLRQREHWERAPVPTAAPPPLAAKPGHVKPVATSGATKRAEHDEKSAAASTVAASFGGEAAAYAEAMELYRNGRYDVAADAFGRFAERFGRSAEAEDAAFLEAAALAHAGRTDAAAVVAERFLRSYPSTSFHTRDAAMLVVRAARDRGECDKALRVASRWTGAGLPPEWVAALGRCRSQ